MPKERDIFDTEEKVFNRKPSDDSNLDGEVSKPDRLWADEALFWRELAGREPSRLNLHQRERSQRGRLADLRLEIRRNLREYVAEALVPVDIQGLELVRSTYDEEELLAVVDVLLDDRVTMGPRVALFEEGFSTYLSASFSIMVNSGSSANWLAFSTLAYPGTDNHLQVGDEVIIPAVAWSTSLFPIVQAGCVPVIVDVDPNTLNVDPRQIEEAITPKTRALMLVHLLGNPCDMTRLMEIARQNKLWVVEDCCESHGASIDGRKVGTFGDLSTFSFFFSHHMTTFEGGAVCGLDNERWRDLLISMRAHGWIRGRSDHAIWEKDYPDIDPRWLFVAPGSNLRATEINAAVGLIQLSRLPGFIEQRCRIRETLLSRLKPYEEFFIFQTALPGHLHTAFGLSLIIRQGAPFKRNEFHLN